MNTPLLIRTLREYLASDSGMMTLLSVSTAADAKNYRLVAKDAKYTSHNESGNKWSYPLITFKVYDDEPMVRGADDNSVFLELVVENKFSNTNALMVNMQIKDKLKLLLEDKHSEVNAVATTFSPPQTLKVRDIAWVSAVVYDDKEQGTERLHKYTCLMKLVVGD